MVPAFAEAVYEHACTSAMCGFEPTGFSIGVAGAAQYHRTLASCQVVRLRQALAGRRKHQAIIISLTRLGTGHPAEVELTSNSKERHVMTTGV